ncbi:MAG: glycosyltransferase family 2 protein [Candidatus Daviesbacteria bacterium]|nr:glycosyltransferase family 2 protein [Candidatus Daviesbacteria bacterium]
MKVSVIIPVFNEEKVIGECLNSLKNQSYKDLEIIVVDDGSSDEAVNVVLGKDVKLLKQNHLGAGAARNLGAKHATGKILVFVDADMEFDEKFIDKLTIPIREKKVIGTFSKEEYVLNKNNIWSKCWNINKGLPFDKMHSLNYPDQQNVFRAILKEKFDKVGGFLLIGYIDDHTLADKLGVQAISAPGAIFYHRNPDNLEEIYKQARWIGKSEFKRRKIKNEALMKFITMIRYSLPLSLLNGVISIIKFGLPQYILFKIIYDLGIETSLVNSFFGEQKYK